MSLPNPRSKGTTTVIKSRERKGFTGVSVKIREAAVNAQKQRKVVYE